jgi:hypothetical protein
MINAIVAFKKAVANVGFKKAVAEIKFGDFLIFRFFFEALGLTDTQEKAMGKSLADSSSVTEQHFFGVNKPFDNSSDAIDSVSLGFGSVKNDLGAASDEIDNFVIGKGLQDSSLVGENHNIDFHKFIYELTAATDDLDGEATAEDDQEMTFTKVRSELAFAFDFFSYSSTSGVSDTIGSNDAGSLRSQGYCSFDYFLEDYVGESRTF